MTWRNARRDVWLWRIAALLVACAWIVVARDPAYRDPPWRRALVGLASARNITVPVVAERADPPDGTDLSGRPDAARVRRAAGEGRHGFLLIWLGDCVSCSGMDLPEQARDARTRGFKVVAVAGSQAVVAPTAASLRRARVSLPIVVDNGTLARVLNAYYVGRVYYFDSAWRLQWKETQMRMDPRLVRSGRLARELRRVQI